MDTLDAILLGIIQGLTEFLPVSSSGHLELGKALLGDTSKGKESLLFTVILHFATALSTVVVFRKDIAEICKGFFQLKWNQETQFLAKIMLSTLPAAFVGLFFEHELEQLFGGKILFVGFMLIVTAVLLWFADKAKNTNKSVSFKNSVVIGLAQAIAILPGISRSGSTIATSVLLGNDKAKAARFSFLMVLPLIFGKILKEVIDGDISANTADSSFLFVGFFAAFVSGYFACKWMISLVKKSKLIYFSLYCFVVGSIAIAVGFLK